jgi:hypothetical protein
VRLFRGPSRPAPTPQDHRRLREALAKLDPWTFWSVAIEDPGADYAVLGVTGAFAIAIVGLEGYVEPSGPGLRIGEVELGGFREVTRAARRLHGRLIEASTFTHVEPVLCLTRATAGSSRTVKGVRVMRVEDVAAEIGGRERTLDPSTAKRATGSLGRVLPSASGPGSDIELPPDPA